MVFAHPFYLYFYGEGHAASVAAAAGDPLSLPVSPLLIFSVQESLSLLNPFVSCLFRPVVRALQVVGDIIPAVPSFVLAVRALEFGYGG